MDEKHIDCYMKYYIIKAFKKNTCIIHKTKMICSYYSLFETIVVITHKDRKEIFFNKTGCKYQ